MKRLALRAQTSHEGSVVRHRNQGLWVRRCSRTAASSLSATTSESTRKRPSLIACLTSSTRAASTTLTLLSASSTRCSKLDPSLSSTLSLCTDDTGPCAVGCFPLATSCALVGAAGLIEPLPLIFTITSTGELFPERFSAREPFG